MSEGIVIVRGAMGEGPWGFDIHHGQKIGHEATYEAAETFARGFGAGYFATTGVVVGIEDQTREPGTTRIPT